LIVSQHFVPRIEAERLIAPYAADLVDIMELAWSDWMASPVARSMEHPRVRANMIWNQIVAHGRDKFHARDGIRIDSMGHYQAGFVIEDRYFIRPKFGNSTLCSRNFPTQSALAFNDQGCDLFGGIGRLDLVYTLNDLETELAEVCLVQRHKKSNVWVIPLIAEADDQQLPIPYIPPAPGGSPADRIIKPKRPAIEHEQPVRRKGTGSGL
jgi:hypothetical protein